MRQPRIDAKHRCRNVKRDADTDTGCDLDQYNVNRESLETQLPLRLDRMGYFLCGQMPRPFPEELNAPGRTRTCDQRIRNPLLYPLSYRGIDSRCGRFQISRPFRTMYFQHWRDTGGRGLDNRQPNCEDHVHASLITPKRPRTIGFLEQLHTIHSNRQRTSTRTAWRAPNRRPAP